MNYPRIRARSEIVKIFLPAILAIVLFTFIIFGFALPVLKKNLIEQKKKQITVLTQTVWNILAYYENDIINGNISKEFAHKRALEQIKQLRYGPEGKDYFWINDLYPRLLMHPYLQELEGKDVSDFMGHGGKLIFKEFITEIKKNDAGFVPYLWQWNDDPTRISQKLSYIKLFKPWGWIIGTGVYLDDVYDEIDKVTQKFLYSSVLILLTVTLLLTLLVFQTIKNRRKRVDAEIKVQDYQANLEKLVEKRTTQLKIEKERLQESEKRFRSLAEASFEGIVIHHHGKIVEANHVLAEMFGYTTDETLHKDISDFIAPVSQKTLIEKITSGYEKPYELTGCRKNGSLFTIEINAKTIPYQGHIYRVASIRDISERKNIETEREELIQQLQTTLEEINVLRGILPICASCKKIRDDKGYWNQIESYIREHSDTRFSHSICPDCAKQLYPNLKFKT